MKKDRQVLVKPPEHARKNPMQSILYSRLTGSTLSNPWDLAIRLAVSIPPSTRIAHPLVKTFSPLLSSRWAETTGVCLGHAAMRTHITILARPKAHTTRNIASLRTFSWRNSVRESMENSAYLLLTSTDVWLVVEVICRATGTCHLLL